MAVVAAGTSAVGGALIRGTFGAVVGPVAAARTARLAGALLTQALVLALSLLFAVVVVAVAAVRVVGALAAVSVALVMRVTLAARHGAVVTLVVALGLESSAASVTAFDMLD